MSDVQDRERTPLDEVADRIAVVMNDYKAVKITAETVDLRLVADLCWALGLKPTVGFSRPPKPDANSDSPPPLPEKG